MADKKKVGDDSTVQPVQQMPQMDMLSAIQMMIDWWQKRTEELVKSELEKMRVEMDEKIKAGLVSSEQEDDRVLTSEEVQAIRDNVVRITEYTIEVNESGDIGNEQMWRPAFWHLRMDIARNRAMNKYGANKEWVTWRLWKKQRRMTTQDRDALVAKSNADGLIPNHD